MLQRANEIQERMVAWRRDFHSHPELSFQELRTAGVIADVLRGLGCEVRTVVGGVGVVGDLGSGHLSIAIRADIDALPIDEANETAYRSQNPGVMHACGHDAHAAILLGVATLLSQTSLPGRVRFLFQPAEETKDENGFSGATRMFQEGVLDGIDAALALHVDSSSPVGKLKGKAGPMSAGSDLFKATIRGKGGHGAYPHLAINPIYSAAYAVLAINSIVARVVAAGDKAVVSIGSLRAGSTANVIPDSAELLGTIRYQDLGLRETLMAQIRAALEGSRALGGDFDLEFQPGLLPVINDPKLAVLVQDVITDLLGPDSYRNVDWGMAGEDFSVFAAEVPGMIFGLGCALDGEMRSHHNPRFDLDERCLPMGAAVLAESALRYLHGSD